MTDQQHPIIAPPPRLVKEWIVEIWHEGTPVQVAQSDLHLAARAAQWGADQELEACCVTIENLEWFVDPSRRIAELRVARRPKPPSLKEQALAELTAWTEMRNGPGESLLCDGLSVATIRRALEALPDD